METIADIVRDRIKRARLDAGLNQKKLADALGLSSHATISRYENGDLNISAEVLYQIAIATNKPISFFFETSETVCSVDDVVRDYTALSDIGRQRLLQYLQDMLKLYPR